MSTAEGKSDFEIHGAKILAILEKDEKYRRQIIDIYKEIEELLSSHPDDCLQNEILARFPAYPTSLKDYQKELHDDERPLIITGEASSGKSTLINALLGIDILPAGTLPTTGVVCRIRNSERKRVEIFEKDGVLSQTIDIGNGKDNDLKDKLKSAISPKEETRQIHNVEYVDIYWPIPFLRKNIMLVDTPGVGESNEMTERLLKYLPKAVGLIYVIDPTHAGGIATDRIVPLIRSPVSLNTKDMKQTVDPSCALFVCNKWDIVQDDGDDAVVFDHVKRKLEKLWLEFDGNQMHCLSAKKALKKRKKGDPFPEAFERFFNAIKDLVERSICAKSRLHKMWLVKFLEHIEVCLDSHLKMQDLEILQKTETLNEAECLLKQLEENSTKSKYILLKEVEDTSQMLAEDFKIYIEGMKKREEIFSWKNIKLPELSCTTWPCSLKNECFKIIHEKVNTELNSFMGIHRKIIMDKFNRFFQTEIPKLMTLTGQLKYILVARTLRDEQHDRYETCIMTKAKDNGSKIPDWACIIFNIASLAANPLAFLRITVLIGELIDVSFYNLNKEEYMNKWSKEFLERCNEELEKHFVTRFCECSRLVSKWFDVEFPLVSIAYKSLISNLRKERRTSQQVVEKYTPMLKKYQQILVKVNDLN